MLWLPYLPDLESESLGAHGSETFKGLAQGEGLSGHIASSAALLRGLGLANLKTYARVTFLLLYLWQMRLSSR